MYIWIYIPHNHGSILDFNWKCTSKILQVFGPNQSYGPSVISSTHLITKSQPSRQWPPRGLPRMTPSEARDDGPIFWIWNFWKMGQCHHFTILFNHHSFPFCFLCFLAVWSRVFPAIALAKGQVCRNLQTSWLIIMVLELCGRKWWSPLYNSYTIIFNIITNDII